MRRVWWVLLIGLLMAVRAGAQERAQEPGEPEAVAQERAAQPLDAPSGEELSQDYAARHALIISIDKYDDPGFPDLSYAVADAQGMAKLLMSELGFPEENVRLLVNGQATRAEVNRALEGWACDERRIGRDDLLVVFFAGHGETRPSRRGQSQKGYLAPCDARRQSGGEPDWGTLIPMSTLEEISELVPAKHALFILDCCFGGLAGERGAPPLAAGLTLRARQVMTAGGADQKVQDAGGGGHSIFTGAVLEGLRGKADANLDKVVTFGELYNYVGRAVESRTRPRQTPGQGTLPDHALGCVALFPPGAKPVDLSVEERLKALELTVEEKLAELERLSDFVVVEQLENEIASEGFGE
ncbi:MAG: caspase family protein [Planctomycetota bacterium]